MFCFFATFTVLLNFTQTQKAMQALQRLNSRISQANYAKYIYTQILNAVKCCIYKEVLKARWQKKWCLSVWVWENVGNGLVKFNSDCFWWLFLSQKKRKKELFFCFVNPNKNVLNMVNIHFNFTQRLQGFSVQQCN